jgi:3-isopropylmalate/(R)-2-methylmalate dehydratase small subunit
VQAGELVCRFQVDEYTRWRLLEGLDDISLTLGHVDAISEFEKSRPSWSATTTPV